ncbi:MAG: hypothetical protein IKB08_00425 [Clostridia bacterium]|nr:hypothetical protein [Clostridia bacterium]
MKIFIWIASFFIIVGIPDALLIEFYDIKFGVIPAILLAGVAYLTAKTLCKKWDIHKASRENSDNKENNIQNECIVFDSNTPTNEASTVKVSAVAKRKKTTSLINTETDIIHTDGSSALDSVKTTNKKNSIINKFTVSIAILCILLCSSIGTNIYQLMNISETQNTISTLENKFKRTSESADRARVIINEKNEEIENLEDVISFYERYIVILPDDNTGTYHIYGCKQCDTSSFWIYTIDDAKAADYQPCNNCCSIIEMLYKTRKYGLKAFFDGN